MITIHGSAGCVYYNQHKTNIAIGWNKTFEALCRFFNGWFKLSNICGAPQILEIVIFMDISVVSKTDFDQTKMIVSFKL